MFIAKISKGRTIKQFINGTLTAPVIYSIVWMVIFGGAGLRHERTASNEGLCCPDGTNFFMNKSYDLTAAVVFDRRDNDSLVVASSAYWLCQDGTCSDCAKSVLTRYQAQNSTYLDMLNDYDSLGGDFGSTSADRSLSKLSCHQVEQMWFDVVRSYGSIGPFLSVFSLVAIVLYFVTSSDSGSLVIDCLSSNGDPDPPRIQRVFWALTEGATATALLVSGGKDGLSALQVCRVVFFLSIWSHFVCS